MKLLAMRANPLLSMEISRGIEPKTLLGLVQNTIPFALERTDPFGHPTPSELPPYLRTLQSAWDQMKLAPEAQLSLSHFQYFELCVAAHFSTVSSFVPTDVDNQIRFKLWHPDLPTPELLAMVSLVRSAQDWDMTALSRRFVRGPKTGRVLSGMHGEWFSIAAAAYGALMSHKKENDAAEMREAILEAILNETRRQASVLGEFIKARDGIGLLAAATTVAHNLGDLDRVMDQWNLAADDPLRQQAYKLAGDSSRDDPEMRLLRLAGNLNKVQMAPTSMADENHRHFPLRAARCLRRSADLLLPIAPFYDDWGALVGKHPALTPEDRAQVVQCLMDGWERLKPPRKTQAYPRALAGIEASFPGGLSRLCQYLPARSAKNLRSGALRSVCSIPRRRFEEQWSELALRASENDLKKSFRGNGKNPDGPRSST
jgi:hypothetical protein